ncbi:45656_t:CDS:2 [Gigaspora margarita]|uniref:45656_t:CDS:1 n=1 Tax=Gigaspora margarita TaxID=4874 RepID=A0ABN7VK72_GIGMA|nr:45656_t:CDS:2 [Gigaspora margarita]
MAGNCAECRTRTGAQYFEEFCLCFWEKPEIQFDQIHNINASSRQQEIRRCNYTFPLSYEEISFMMSRREFTTIQRDHSASPDHRVSSNKKVSTNRNNENNESKNRSKGLLLHNNSNNLVNTAPKHRSEGSFFYYNASQNDSDISMPDIGGSQPPFCIKNINEENYHHPETNDAITPKTNYSTTPRPLIVMPPRLIIPIQKAIKKSYLV